MHRIMSQQWKVVSEPINVLMSPQRLFKEVLLNLDLQNSYILRYEKTWIHLNCSNGEIVVSSV